MLETPPTITHLIGPDTPALRGEVLRALCDQPQPRHRIIQWGPAPAWATTSHQSPPLTEQERIEPDRTIHAPFGATWLGQRARDSLLAEIGTGVLHVWSLTALRWVAAGLGRARCQVIVDIELPAALGRLASAIGSAWRDGRLCFVCPTDAARQQAVATGARSADCVLIRDCVDFARINAARSERVRKTLRLATTDVVLLALPPALPETATFTAAWGALLLAQVIPRARLIVPGRGREVERVRRLVASCRQEHVLRSPGMRFDLYALLAAADVALYLPPGGAPLAGMAAAMGAAVPIVATATPLTTELLRHGHNAWLTLSDQPRDICRRLLDAIENRAQSRRQADTARAQAYKVFSRRRLIEQYARLWSNVTAGEPPASGIDDPAYIGAASR